MYKVHVTNRITKVVSYCVFTNFLHRHVACYSISMCYSKAQIQWFYDFLLNYQRIYCDFTH